MAISEVRSRIKEEETKGWKLEEIARTLSTSFKPHEDKIGRGVYCRFGDKGRGKFLAVYPGESIVRVAKNRKEIILQGVDFPIVTDRTVIFDVFDEDDSYRLRLMRNGDVKYYVRRKLDKQKEDIESGIEFSGKVIMDPICERRDGALIARFPVALVDGSGETELQTVIISGGSLKEIISILKKGRLVTVKGFSKEREVVNQRGETKKFKDFNANTISISFVSR